jgi:hypothetical protein
MPSLERATTSEAVTDETILGILGDADLQTIKNKKAL